MALSGLPPKQRHSRRRAALEIVELEQRLTPALTPMVQAVGAVSMSIDGLGAAAGGGIIQVEKPAGATVRSAYMVATTNWQATSILPDGAVAIDGVPVNWGTTVVCPEGNSWADVTALVKTKIDTAAPGRVDFAVTEPFNSSNVNGELLAVIFDDPNVTTINTVAFMFGWQSLSGDTFNLLLANPVNLADATLIIDMSLGLSNSQAGGQASNVDVNGQRVTSSAGGYDDGFNSGGGSLFTVGGLDDINDNPIDPLATDSDTRYDDELYNLIPFINDGATSISVFTQNPSRNDNIFFAAFKMTIPAVVGEGILLSPGSTSMTVGNSTTVTAQVQDAGGSPIVGTTVTFTVVSGPNAGLTGTATTNAGGQAVYSYSSAVAGTDIVQTSFINTLSQTVISNTVQATWTPPPSGVTIAQSGGATTVNEGATTDAYTAVLISQPTADVILTISTDSQTTVALSTLTFTSANWNTPQTMTVSATDDLIAEGSHTSIITHSSSSADFLYNNLTISPLTATIIDDDVAGITIVPSGGFTAVTEGGAADTYTVVLDTQPANNVSVTIAPGTQVTVAPSVLTFTTANWNNPQTVTVTAVDDLAGEVSPQNAVITHTAGSGDPFYQGLAIATVTARVTDNDPPGVVVAPSGAATSVAEGGAGGDYTVSLLSAPSANVFITLNPGSQLVATPTVLTFTSLNWNTAQTVTVTALDDLLVESPHTGVIVHTATSGDALYNGLPIASVTANIADNDVAGVVVTHSGGSTSVTEGGTTDTYMLTLATIPAANVTVNLNPGTQVALSGNVYTFTAATWNVPQTVTVTAVDDLTAEGTPHFGTITGSATSPDPIYNLAVTGVTVRITDNDVASVTITQSGSATDVSESGANDSVTVVLSSQPTANVTVTITPLSQVTASASLLTFAPAAWNVPQTVALSAVNDQVAEGNHTGIVRHTASSADPFYSGLTIAAVTANITDDDTAGVVLLQSGGSTLVGEDGSSDTYMALLSSQPTATVVVALAPGSQLGALPLRLTFTPTTWNVPQTVSVRAIDDNVTLGTHTSLITHTTASADPGYNAIAVNTVTVTIADNDNPDVLFTITNSSISLLEGSSKGYSAVLKTQPLADVVLTMNADSQVAVSPATMTFTPATWNKPQPLLLTANDDGAVEGSHVGVVTHMTSSADVAYNGLAVADITANVVDNEGTVISGTSRADKIIATFSATQVVVSINGVATVLPALGQLIIQGDLGNDDIYLASPTIPVLVLGASGTDRVFVTGQSSANAFSLNETGVVANGSGVCVWGVEGLIVAGRGGNDTFTVTGVPTFAVEFKGDQGNDQIIGPDRTNTWKITANNLGTLDTSIKINSVESWTGGAAADTFVFSTGKSLGQLDGGAGTNTLDYSTTSSPVTVNLRTGETGGVTSLTRFQNMSRFLGSKGADKLVGLDQNNLWNITGNNNGTVSGRLFQGFENLTGGAQDDTFRFTNGQSIKGKVDGGGGIDRLDFSGYVSRGVVINLAAKTATATAGFLNIEQFTGGGSSTLIGPNQTSAWHLTGLGSGDVAGIAFTDFANLTGGSQSDTFTLEALAGWLGTLSGGSGKDSLIAPMGGIWNAAGSGAGSLNGHKFLSVETR